MRMTRRMLLAVALAGLLVPSVMMAASVKKYQVTGKVLEVTPTMIVIEKGDEKWEINRDAKTAVTGKLEVGAKVTIEYRMTATTVEVKGKGAAEKPEKKSGQ